jgi:hypothetical protein
MPALIIPHCVEVVVKGHHVGNEVNSVFNYYTPSSITSAQAQSIAIGFRDNVLTSYRACLTAAYFAEVIHVKDLSVANGVTYDLLLVGPYPGTRGGNDLPGSVALVASWRTALSGRSYRGRTYLGPLAESDVSGDTAAASLTSAVAAFIATIIGYHPLGALLFSVASRHLHGINQIFAGIVDAIVDSQRRRLTGRGN